MNRMTIPTRPLLWSVALLTLAMALGCEGSRAPILGMDGVVAPLPAAPTVTAVTPVNNATAVSLNPIITATFSEPMAPIMGAATFTVVAAAPAASPLGTVTLDASHTKATFTLSAGTALVPLTAYTATVTGATSLASGRALASPYVWHFTTASTVDTTRPRVKATVPVTSNPPVINVLTNTAISATFTEAMKASTITSASFTVTGPGAAPVAGNVTYAASKATFIPTGLLAFNTTYTATITTAATDLAGNTLAGNQALFPAASNYVWSFTTAAVLDVIPPTITLTNPADLATGVALNASVNATFSEAMDPATLSTVTFTVQPAGPPVGTNLTGAVAYNATTHIATFTPSSPLLASTTYTATVTNVATDLAGNALAPGLKPNPWTFTTGASVVPPGIDLGSAGSFGIMATLAISDAGGSFINGDVALDPGTSCGLLPVQVNGVIHINDAVSAAAKIDLLTTFNYCMALPSGATTPDGGDLGAWMPPGSTLPAGTLPPGVYTNGSSMLVATALTLDAGGNPNAIWVFQIGSALTTTTPLGNINLANGALAKNVFWVTGTDATVGVNTIFNGTIVAGRDATGQTGAVINGRILAGATNPGTIALDSNTVTVPAP